jgi:DNA-binding beta-propeller fold protein YncE
MAATPFALSPALDVGMVSSIAIDKAGNFYLLQRGPNADPVIVTDRAGKVLRSWGKGLYTTPHSIRIDPGGNVWTTDATSSMVYQFSPEGKKLLEISVGEVPAGITSPFRAVTDMAFAPNGHVYLSDGYGNARILEYDAQGKRLRQWGTPGTGPGQFRTPHGIALGPDGNLYVADRENGRVQWFDLNGKYLGEWKYGGRVYSLVFDGAGELYLATGPTDTQPVSEGWLLHVDRRNGKVLGAVATGGVNHSIAVTPDGALASGKIPNGIQLFRPTPKK